MSVHMCIYSYSKPDMHCSMQDCQISGGAHKDPFDCCLTLLGRWEVSSYLHVWDMLSVTESWIINCRQLKVLSCWTSITLKMLVLRSPVVEHQPVPHFKPMFVWGCSLAPALIHLITSSIKQVSLEAVTWWLGYRKKPIWNLNRLTELMVKLTWKQQGLDWVVEGRMGQE